jgi:hypothetical protein
MREKYPEIYFQSMVKLALVHRVEVGQPKEFDKPRTVEEALAQLEERVGTKGRRLFEDFLRKAERLEAEENGEGVAAPLHQRLGRGPFHPRRHRNGQRLKRLSEITRLPPVNQPHIK